MKLTFLLFIFFVYIADFKSFSLSSRFKKQNLLTNNNLENLKLVIKDLVRFRIIQIIKLEDLNKQQQYITKVFEVNMPIRGQEIKIKHNLNIDSIYSVNVIVLNGPKNNKIIRSQVDLISQKALYNWYVDKNNFVLIRPNNVCCV